MTETDEKEILQRLLVDEHEVLKNLETIVNKALKVFRIEKPSGRITFQNLGSLTTRSESSDSLLANTMLTKTS